MFVIFLTVLISTLLLLCITGYLFKRRVRQGNLPPGPPSVPLLGSLLHVERPFWRWALRNRRRYPDMVCLADLDAWVIVLNSHDAIRDALLGPTAADLRGRPPYSELDENLTPNDGLVLDSGPHWATRRGATFACLRALGLGGERSAELARCEVDKLVDHIRKHGTAPLSTDLLLYKAVSPVICTVVGGTPLTAYEVSAYWWYTTRGWRVVDTVSTAVRVVHRLAWFTLLRLLCLWLHRGLRRAMQMHLFVTNLFVRIVDARELAAETNTDVDEESVFLDAALRWKRDEIAAAAAAAGGEMKEGSSDTPEAVVWNDAHLLLTTMELVDQTTEPVANTLAWALLYLATNPGVQTSLHAELLVNVDDDTSSDLLHAVLHEVLRLRPVVSPVLRHRVRLDQPTTLRGYHIPAGSVLVLNTPAANTDDRVYGDNAEAFEPGRYLQCSSTLGSVIGPFSVGQRACPGQTFALQQLRVYLAALLRHFQVTLAAGEEKRLPEIMHGVDRLFWAPAPHKLVFTAR